jgi:predicted site-specific integrase-resolvase
VTDSSPAAQLADMPLMTTAEFAACFRVEPKTARRWIASGIVRDVVRTPGGRIRIRPEVVDEMLRASAPQQEVR